MIIVEKLYIQYNHSTIQHCTTHIIELNTDYKFVLGTLDRTEAVGLQVQQTERKKEVGKEVEREN